MIAKGNEQTESRKLFKKRMIFAVIALIFAITLGAVIFIVYQDVLYDKVASEEPLEKNTAESRIPSFLKEF